MLDELSVDELKQQLTEKNQTVATLTEYLEQAAEKLNNLQKQTSAHKPVQAFDAEMVHRQMELVSQLKAAVKEWEDLQAPSTLERIGTQLDTLRETILDGLSQQQSSPLEPTTPNPQELPTSTLSTAHLMTSSISSESGDGEESGLSGWEALKAEMLQEEGTTPEIDEEVQNIDLREELDVLVNRPAPVDQDCHDCEMWQEAVDARETYMISLIRALRVVESRRRGAPDWESFTNAPEPLREEVAQYAAELHQTLRNAEVELSIERARISRQESVIAQQRREIDKALKKQGLNQPQSKTDPNDSQQGRWLKFLGRGGDEDS
ncbi:MAG: hypothetical protein KDA84_03255 [Planctomycetaceae bacterium]|nr:hypothetical protein [Planctomycetaceae bacterium]